MPEPTNGKPPIMNMTINLGSILTIISMLMTISFAYAAISGRLAVLETEVQQVRVIERKVDAVDAKLSDLSYKEGQQEQKLEDERHEH